MRKKQCFSKNWNKEIQGVKSQNYAKKSPKGLKKCCSNMAQIFLKPLFHWQRWVTPNLKDDWMPEIKKPSEYVEIEMQAAFW